MTLKTIQQNSEKEFELVGIDLEHDAEPLFEFLERYRLTDEKGNEVNIKNFLSSQLEVAYRAGKEEGYEIGKKDGLSEEYKDGYFHGGIKAKQETREVILGEIKHLRSISHFSKGIRVSNVGVHKCNDSCEVLQETLNDLKTFIKSQE